MCPPASTGRDLADFHRFLSDELTGAWCDAYEKMPNDGVEIVEFDDHGFRFLFDLVAERVVAAFGVSAPTRDRRDAARMAGFLGGSTRRRAGPHRTTTRPSSATWASGIDSSSCAATPTTAVTSSVTSKVVG